MKPYTDFCSNALYRFSNTPALNIQNESVCVCVYSDKLLRMVIYYRLVHGKSTSFAAFPSTKRDI